MNTIYNIFKRTVAAIALVLGMTSCLDKFPGDAILENQGMKTFNDAEQTLTGIYNAYMSGALYSGYLTLLPDIQADLVHAVQGNSNTYGQFWRWDIRPTNSEIEAVYGSLYTVIARCNFYLDQVEELRGNITDDDALTALDYYTGEVYCARANAYFSLSSVSVRRMTLQRRMSSLELLSTAHISEPNLSIGRASRSHTISSSVTWRRLRTCLRRTMTTIPILM